MLLCGEWMKPSGQFIHWHVGNGTSMYKTLPWYYYVWHGIIVITYIFYIFFSKYTVGNVMVFCTIVYTDHPLTDE